MFTDSIVSWRWWWWRLLLEQIPVLEFALIGWYRDDLENLKDNHRTEPQTSTCRRSEWKAVSLFCFFFPLARATLGACIFLGFIAPSSYQKRLLLLQPKPWLQLWRQASQFLPSLPAVHGCQILTLLVQRGKSAQHSLWSGQGFGDQSQRLPTTTYDKMNAGSYPTHIGSISGIASAASGGGVSERASIGTARLWAFLSLL